MLLLRRKVVSAITLTLLLAGMLTLANIQSVRASGTIYIRADGSIDPPTANIITTDSVTYTFTDNIIDSIVVERDDIVIDGAGYTLQEPEWVSNGIDLTGRTNVTVRNTQIRSFEYGIWLNSSSSNSISGNNIIATGYGIRLISSSSNSVSGNNITNNSGGIWLDSSSSNSISENNITGGYDGIVLVGSFSNSISGNNLTANAGGAVLLGIVFFSSSNNSVSGNNIRFSGDHGFGIVFSDSDYNNVSGNNITDSGYYGIWLNSSSGNSFCHNRFIDNAWQVNVLSGDANVWDDGYPSGGNYWSDYKGIDFYKGPYQNETGSDGIGDTPYVIDANNKDKYPLGVFGVPIPGDLNYDSSVNILDAIQAASAFGSIPGKPNWNSEADLNSDNIIDIFDLIILAGNFGKRTV